MLAFEQFFPFELLNPLFHSLRDGWRLRFKNPVYQLVNVLLNLVDLRLERLAARITSGKAVVPQILETGVGNSDQFF
ncbi:MAG: hypothetical protein WDO68_22240 [Gammaproteobacteria bacterium]